MTSREFRMHKLVRFTTLVILIFESSVVFRKLTQIAPIFAQTRIFQNKIMQKEEILEDLYKIFPTLSLAKVQQNEVYLQNVIKVKDHWFRYQLRCPNFPNLTDMKLLVQKSHIMECLPSDSSYINFNWSIKELLQNMPQIITEINKLEDEPQIKVHNIYAELLDLYNPEAYEIEYTENLSIIKFSKFSSSEQHYLELEVTTLKVKSHSLPDCVPIAELLRHCTTLEAIVQQFQNLLIELCCFYDNFADIDELCHVLQPVPATTKHNWRLFPLREKVFIKLLINDPFAPLASMSVQFIGPTKDVEELRRIYSMGINNWDAELDIHKNLLRIFDLCFFPMPTTNVQDTTAEEEQSCNICYSFQSDEGEVPVVSCDNPRCSLLCHASCLKQWFNSLTEGKVFLDVSFLECPFCKSEFSTSFTKTMLN